MADLLAEHGHDVRTHGIWHVRSSLRLAAKGAPADEATRFVGLHGHPFDGDDRVALAHLNRGYATRQALLLGDSNCVPEKLWADRLL